MSTTKQTKKQVARDVKRDLKREMPNRQGPLNASRSKEMAAFWNGKNTPSSNKKIEKSIDKACRNMQANLKAHIKIQNCCSPQACAFIKLMDDPFNAPWEDAKFPFYVGSQPVKSTVIRAYGVNEISTVANQTTQIYWQPNPWDSFNAGGDPMIQKVVQGATLNRGVPGCPPFATANASDDVAVPGNQSGPHCGFYRSVAKSSATVFNNLATDTAGILPWVTASMLGDDAPDLPGTFAYRLLAAGFRLFCENKEIDLGGSISSARIPESTNFGYHGTSKMFGNSTTHWMRGSNSLELKYMRSADDAEWNYPSATLAGVNTSIGGRRSQINFTPPDATTVYTLIVQYVAFYEVKGVAANQVGTMSFNQPKDAGKIATGIAVATSEQSGSPGRREIEKSVEYVNAKESPVTGPLAKNADSHSGFMDAVDDVIEFVKPLAKSVLKGVETVAPLAALL